jgi:2-polyprenyl-3-methyl-5-hydroxy-6-metoxy-1,4-benzoquinol methylase
MTPGIEGTRRAPRRNNLLAKLRMAFRLLRTVDLEDLIAQFDARQRKLERSQRDIALLLTNPSENRELLQRPDLTAIGVGLLDIKNLGYELGRQLAEKNFADRSVVVDHTRLRSKLCTQNDFSTDWLFYWCHELRSVPFYHRKLWELCYVSQVLFSEGQLAPGHRGIGFGCGEESLPSLFAKYGAMITATDLEATRPEAEVWRSTAQHASAIEAIRRPDICPDQQLLANIEFHPADMNAIPREFDGQFDFCWSTCALEHLGSIENGLTFIENSLRTLKPGGLAVHTTEFTVTEGETIDNHPVVLYQRHHLEKLADRLRTGGYEVVDFDFSPGDGVLDRFVDLPPFQDKNNVLMPLHHFAHLKLLLDGYTCTSIGMIIKA